MMINLLSIVQAKFSVIVFTSYYFKKKCSNENASIYDEGFDDKYKLES